MCLCVRVYVLHVCVCVCMCVCVCVCVCAAHLVVACSHLLTLQGFIAQMNPDGSSDRSLGEVAPQALPGSLLSAGDSLHWERCDSLENRDLQRLQGEL